MIKKTFYIIITLLIFCPISAAAVTEPKIIINSPADNYLTNISAIAVTGVTEPGSILYLNGLGISNNNGAFFKNVTIVEGLNRIIVTAQKNGNVSKAVVNVTLDTISPEISIMLPNNTYINSTFLNLSYISNASDVEIYRVRLNKRVWEETNKSYYYLFNLTEGISAVEVQAIDHAGNIGEAGVVFTVDSTPPVIEITKPVVNETISSRFIELAGRTEIGANISVNGVNISNDNGTWSIAVILSGVNNPFRIESIDRAGNKAEKTINIRIGENFSLTPYFEDFLNLSLNFSQPGKFDGSNDAVSGKYVSFLFDKNASAFIGYSINDGESTTLWFDNIIIKNFTADTSSVSGSVVKYRQSQKFGVRHFVEVEMHDNRMGTLLLDFREPRDIYSRIRDYLLNRARERLKINVSRDKNVTMEINNTGTTTQYYINDSWKVWPEVVFEPANNVNVTEMNNGFRFMKDNKEAYLFKANYTAGYSDFKTKENKLMARVNNSLLIFWQFPRINLTGENILGRLISQGISNGIIGAEFFVDSAGSYDVVAFGDVNLSARFPDVNTMELNVSSGSHNGTVLAFVLSGKFYDNLLNKKLTIRYDGNIISQANDYQDIMDVTNDFGRAEYLPVMGSKGAMILVSIPAFSSHIISFKFEPLQSTYGSQIATWLNFLSAGLFLALPATSREALFSIWWFVMVLIIYIVVRKAVRKRK